MAAYTDAGKMYTFIKGYALGAHLDQTLQALTFARRVHSGQCRKSGEPYIIHPLTMACHAISLGIDDDIVLAALLLHDVFEDLGINPSGFPVNDDVRRVVFLVSFIVDKDIGDREKSYARDAHYKAMREDPRACLVKLIDRCNNVSTMAGVFTEKKIGEYITETYSYVLPLYRFLKDIYPEYEQPLFSLKYHIISVMDAIKATIETYKEE